MRKSNKIQSWSELNTLLHEEGYDENSTNSEGISEYKFIQRLKREKKISASFLDQMKLADLQLKISLSYSC